MRQNVVFALKVGLVALCFLNVIELAIFSEVQVTVKSGNYVNKVQVFSDGITNESAMGLAKSKPSLNVFRQFNEKFYLQKLYSKTGNNTKGWSPKQKCGQLMLQ